MRGLTDAERDAMLAPCAICCYGGDAEEMDSAIQERLESRGLIYWVDCVDPEWEHCEPTALGKLALELDTAARKTVDL